MTSKEVAIFCAMLFPTCASGAAGDLDVTYSIKTAHTESQYYTREHGYKDYYEDNQFIGFRYGVTDNLNIGYAKGVNSYEEDSRVFASELTYRYFHRTNLVSAEIGFMAGMADGYEVISSSGWTFVGGPFLRLKTPIVGFTLTTYGTDAAVLTADIPIRSKLRGY